MSKPFKSAAGQQLDNRPAEKAVSIWPDGADPEVDPPALVLPAVRTRMTVVSKVHRDRSATFSVRPSDSHSKAIGDRLRILRATLPHIVRKDLPPEELSHWMDILDEAVASVDNGRGAPRSPACITTFELLDAEVLADRDPFNKRLAGIIARKVMSNPDQVRDWRKMWARERGYRRN
jgi:hypothetical protein